MTIRSVVLGCGSYLPQRILTNAELATRIDTSDEWIVQRTGIRQRHIAADGEFTSHLAINAARAALADADIDAQSIDLIVLATGYKGQEHLVRKLFGEATAARVGPIWGFGDGQELRNMYVRTPQPGLWFIAGSLAQCRINSKYLALQIKAVETGLLPRQPASAGG